MVASGVVFQHWIESNSISSFSKKQRQKMTNFPWVLLNKFPSCLISQAFCMTCSKLLLCLGVLLSIFHNSSKSSFTANFHHNKHKSELHSQKPVDGKNMPFQYIIKVHSACAKSATEWQRTCIFGSGFAVISCRLILFFFTSSANMREGQGIMRMVLNHQQTFDLLKMYCKLYYSGNYLFGF